MGYPGPVRRFDWSTWTSEVDVEATVTQRYYTHDYVHGNNGEIVRIDYETSLSTNKQDITQALRDHGYNPADFYSRTDDYAERRGDKDGYRTSSHPYC